LADCFLPLSYPSFFLFAQIVAVFLYVPIDGIGQDFIAPALQKLFQGGLDQFVARYAKCLRGNPGFLRRRSDRETLSFIPKV
jgi:hypothetical protein